MKKWLVSVFLTALILLGAGLDANAALTLTIDDSGQLTGATNVEVNGSLYDVSFTEGSFESLFGSMPGGTSPFTFTNLEDATAASQAILDTVLIDDYDIYPQLTFGIESEYLGDIITPYALHNADQNVYYSYARNKYPFNNDYTNARYPDYLPSLPVTHDTSADFFLVYADWTPASVTPTPVPASVLLFGSGLAGLSLFRRRKLA